MPYQSKTPYPHTCPVCGTRFLHGSSRRIYCSSACAGVGANSRRRLGRPRGEAHHAARLTEQQVVQIRQQYRRGGRTHGPSIRDLAEQFGVDYRTVWRVVQRRSWVHVD